MRRSRHVVWYVLLPTLLVTAGYVMSRSPRLAEEARQLQIPRIEAEPLCPWRDPEADLRVWFPDATGYRTETRILSGKRLELAKRLQRMPEPGDNALQIHRVYRDSVDLGAVLTRRVKGEWGAIELVVALTDEGRVRGVRLQRSREPEVVRQQLQRPDWLGAFAGQTLTGQWTLEGDFPEVVPEARISATAVADGVRSLLVLYATAREADPSLVRHDH
jgi:hypothetical protein